MMVFWMVFFFILFIHQVPPKYSGSTPSKELPDSNLANFSSTPSATPSDTKYLSSTWKVSYGKDSMAPNSNCHIAEGSEDVHFPSVPPKSTQIAMKILDHLNRTIPSPKEKMIYSPEMIGTKSVSKFSSDWHTKKPDDGKTKASLLSKGAAEKDNFPEEKVFLVSILSFVCLIISLPKPVADTYSRLANLFACTL